MSAIPVSERPSPVTRALAWSLALHVLAVVVAALPFVREALAAWQAASQVRAAAQAVAITPPPLEIEVVVPEVTTERAPPPPEKDFIRTDGLAEARPDPGKSRFISDRDTRAASPGPADPSATESQPTQDGIDIPVVEVIRNVQSDGEDEALPPAPDALATAAPAAAASTPESEVQTPDSPRTPAESPESPAPDTAEADPSKAIPPEATDPVEPAEAPPPIPTPVEERLALTRESDLNVAANTVKPPPSPKPKPATPLKEAEIRDTDVAARPPAPRPSPPTRPPSDSAPPAGFSSLRAPTKLRGTISNQGPSSVDAEDTPTGRYMKQVTSAIEKEWHRKRRVNRDFVTFGTIKLEFFVTARGEVEDLTIKNRTGANAVMQDFTLNAVLDARIPPMPSGLTEILDRERLLISYDIIVY